jgi:hypothetical protein
MITFKEVKGRDLPLKCERLETDENSDITLTYDGKKRYKSLKINNVRGEIEIDISKVSPRAELIFDDVINYNVYEDDYPLTLKLIDLSEATHSPRVELYRTVLGKSSSLTDTIELAFKQNFILRNDNGTTEIKGVHDAKVKVDDFRVSFKSEIPLDNEIIFVRNVEINGKFVGDKLKKRIGLNIMDSKIDGDVEIKPEAQHFIVDKSNLKVEKLTVNNVLYASGCPELKIKDKSGKTVVNNLNVFCESPCSLEGRYLDDVSIVKGEVSRCVFSEGSRLKTKGTIVRDTNFGNGRYILQNVTTIDNCEFKDCEGDYSLSAQGVFVLYDCEFQKEANSDGEVLLVSNDGEICEIKQSTILGDCRIEDVHSINSTYVNSSEIRGCEKIENSEISFSDIGCEEEGELGKIISQASIIGIKNQNLPAGYSYVGEEMSKGGIVSVKSIDPSKDRKNFEIEL